MAADENAQSSRKEICVQPSGEVKPSSREQVIENYWLCLFPHYILWLSVLTICKILVSSGQPRTLQEKKKAEKGTILFQLLLLLFCEQVSDTSTQVSRSCQ